MSGAEGMAATRISTGKGRRTAGEQVASGPELPRVSVIIPFYKQAKYLPAAVASVRAQDYPNCELIVVDDGSPVPASEVLEDAGELVLIRTENRGVSAARNTGAARSTGEYLLFFDADDLMPPGSIAAHVEAMRNVPEAALCFAARRDIEADGTVFRADHICRPRRSYFHMLLQSNPLGGPGTCLIRSAAFGKAGGFDESLAMAEDYDLWLKLAMEGPVVRHTHCVMEYRRHETNVSSDQEAMLASTLFVLDRLAPRLAPGDRRRIGHAKQRWRHVFLPRPGWRYRLAGLYYGLRAMRAVDWRGR